MGGGGHPRAPLPASSLFFDPALFDKLGAGIQELGHSVQIGYRHRFSVTLVVRVCLEMIPEFYRALSWRVEGYSGFNLGEDRQGLRLNTFAPSGAGGGAMQDKPAVGQTSRPASLIVPILIPRRFSDRRHLDPHHVPAAAGYAGARVGMPALLGSGSLEFPGRGRPAHD